MRCLVNKAAVPLVSRFDVGERGRGRSPTRIPLEDFWNGLEREVRDVLGAGRHARAALDTGGYPCSEDCEVCREAREYGFGHEEAL